MADDRKLNITKRWLVDRIRTPIGDTVVVCGEDGALRVACWEINARPWQATLERHHPNATLVSQRDPFGCSAALQAYMAGDLAALDKLRVAPAGTDFQLSVWAALRAIPVGQTRSYGELAKAIGRPKAVRAVGLANGANPICIIVPCHRVIGSNGSLTGFGGGLDRKRWLLTHEHALH